MRTLLIAALSVAALAGPASAEIVTLKFAGNVAGITGNVAGDANFTQAQRDYIYGIQGFQPPSTLGSAYSFTLQYDTAATPVAGKYALTLVSGFVGPHTDFSDWTPYIQFAPAGAYTYMNFFLQKNTQGSGFPMYAAFALGDNDGTVQSGVLPSTVVPGDYDFVNVSFEVYGSNGAYRSWCDCNSRGALSVVPPGTGGPIAAPEPAAWALMILGFGGVGGAMRARRKAIPTPTQA